ncbi:helix-turn-helix domain-containing protein [Pseudooceanicola sp.]|uniref:IclR family transcriptional regulator n=1 Tax=Pseudooceanicola sp. TaxID=1914328 RepID=UPI0026132FB7|nr:helix-turn-helix domain-containing protein [Pseudooceanicola sp.]MDF1854417.1 helix-turn-helix domain-containing protein [Pseudooceanicola sp.]
MAFVKSAERVFFILEMFEKTRAPMTLHDVAKTQGWPTSSTAALLKTLVKLGYLDHDRYTRTYFPTMRIAELGRWVDREIFEDPTIFNQINVMSEATQEAITLGTQSDLYTQYVHAVPSSLTFAYNPSIGFSRLLAFSGPGWLLLGRHKDEQIEKLVRRMNALPNSGYPRVDLDVLMRHVETGRMRGWTYSRNLVYEGVGVIAFNMPQGRHKRYFTLAIHGPLNRLDEKQPEIFRLMADFMGRFE